MITTKLYRCDDKHCDNPKHSRVHYRKSGAAYVPMNIIIDSEMLRLKKAGKIKFSVPLPLYRFPIFFGPLGLIECADREE